MALATTPRRSERVHIFCGAEVPGFNIIWPEIYRYSGQMLGVENSKAELGCLNFIRNLPSLAIQAYKQYVGEEWVSGRPRASLKINCISQYLRCGIYIIASQMWTSLFFESAKPYSKSHSAIMSASILLHCKICSARGLLSFWKSAKSESAVDEEELL